MSQISHANFFSTVHTPCCVVGFEFSFRQFNQAYIDTFGYSNEELNNRMFSELIHEEDLPKVEQYLDELSNSSVSLSFQCRMRHHDGHFLNFLWQATPSLMEFAFYAVGIEISELVQQTQENAKNELQEELVILQEKYADLEIMYQELQEHNGDTLGTDFDWQAIINCMHEGVVTREPDGKLYSLNLERTEELINKPLTTEEFEMMWDIAKNAKSPSSPVSYTFKRMNRTQNLKVFGLQHIAEDGKTPTGRTIIFSDMTEQSKLQKTLQNKEEDWGLLTAHLIGVMEWHISSGKVQYSDNWPGMLGLQSSQLSHDLKTWQARIHPGDFPLVMNSLKVFLSNKKGLEAYENTHRLQHHNGNYRWFKLSGDAKRDANGKAERFIGSFQDITERKHLEDALQTAQMSEKILRNERFHYETLFNAVPFLIIYKDCNSQILRMNRCAEEWLRESGIRAKESSQRDLSRGYIDQYFADDQEVITTGQAKYGLIEKSRGHYFRTDKLPYRDADGKILGLIVLAQDITEWVKDKGE
jgi:PAS domain S-box-containing protein